MRVRKRWIVSIAGAAVVALALSGIALAGGASSGAGKVTVGPWGRGLVPSHPSSAAKPSGAKGVSYYIVAVTQQSAFIDADDSGSTTPGDYVVFTDALYDHAHQQVGQDHAQCTLNYQAEVCHGTFTLYGSDIAVYGTLTATSEALSVSGGTGSYFGESGEADITGGGENTTDFTITLT
jgi:hypothetical protein